MFITGTNWITVCWENDAKRHYDQWKYTLKKVSMKHGKCFTKFLHMHAWNDSRYKINTFNQYNFPRKRSSLLTAWDFLFVHCQAVSRCLSVSILPFKCWIQQSSEVTLQPRRHVRTHDILIFPGGHLKMQLLKFLKCLPPKNHHSHTSSPLFTVTFISY